MDTCHINIKYIFLSFASNRGPVVLLIETLTFNSGTGWTRIHIWRNGIDDVMRNPIFGIGLNDWTRPFWLTSSVDNFWLLTAMRYGIVGFSFLAAGVAWHAYKVLTAKGLTAYERQLRVGYMIGLISLSLSLATVHIWGPPFVLFLAYIGAGVWFYTRPAPAEGELEEAQVVSTRRSGDLPLTRAVAAPPDDATRGDMPFRRPAARPPERPSRPVRRR